MQSQLFRKVNTCIYSLLLIPQLHFNLVAEQMDTHAAIGF